MRDYKRTLVYTVSDFSEKAAECINLLFEGIEKDEFLDFCVISNKPSPEGFKYKTIVVETTSNYIGHLKYYPGLPNADRYLYLDSDILFFGHVDTVFSENFDLSVVVEDFSLNGEWFSYHISNKNKLPYNVFGLNGGTFAFKDRNFLIRMTEKIDAHFDSNYSPHLNAMLEQSLFNEAIGETCNYDWSLVNNLTEIARLHVPDSCIYDSKIQIYHFCGWTGGMSSKYSRMLNFLERKIWTDKGFMHVGVEGFSFTGKSTYNAAYGSGDSFYYKYGITGTIIFNNETFGDPCPGIPKQAYLSVDCGILKQLAPPPPMSGFEYAGEEGSRYSCENLYDAAYGTGDKFFYKTDISGDIVFNNRTFGGDPCYGTRKNGYIFIKNKMGENERFVVPDPVVEIRCFGAPFDINFSSCGKIKLADFSWSNQDQEINIYIDNAIAAGVHHDIKNKDKAFGWICESKMISPHITEDVLVNYKKYKNIYKKIFTYDQELIKLDPDFFEYCFTGSNYPWTPRDEFGIHEKTKLVSFLSSNKNTCAGHSNRLDWANRLNGLVDFYGGVMGSQIIGGSHCYHHNKKTEALKDYMFSIVIENCKMDTYFTEKITDCFANGTIPIYFGTDNIGSVFNPDGIIVLNENFDVSMLTEELYYSKMQAIRDNLEIVKNMPLADEMLYRKIKKND